MSEFIEPMVANFGRDRETKINVEGYADATAASSLLMIPTRFAEAHTKRANSFGTEAPPWAFASTMLRLETSGELRAVKLLAGVPKGE
jgi:hypothetical protein